jgi:UDP-N-acetylmuramoyl-tripeptide--D-alanyl-D-alanine ligase
MLTLNWIVEQLAGAAYSGPTPALPIHEVVIDSRAAGPGALFVALPGERVDGHDFVAQAFERGASAALVGRAPGAGLRTIAAEAATAADLATPVCLQVPDPLKTLQNLAAAWRARFSPRVIGVTGSIGKTTTKELIASVLAVRYSTLKSEGNLNNEIGLPLSLLRLRQEHEVAVFEMGFYVPGEIAQLCGWARPEIGVVNNVYAVHLERAGSLDAIVRGKRELVEALPGDGVAILNADEPLVLGMRDHSRARVVTYGQSAEADLQATEITTLGFDGIRFTARYAGSAYSVETPLLGAHSALTALRAAAVGLVCGLTWDEILTGLLKPGEGARIRLKLRKGPRGSTLIDDAYNASPESTVAALNVLAEAAGRKVAVLGDMLELGAGERAAHERVGARAAEVAALLVTVGRRARWIAEAARAHGLADVIAFDDLEAASAAVPGLLQPGDTVLLKASLGMAFAGLVRTLTEAVDAC